MEIAVSSPLSGKAFFMAKRRGNPNWGKPEPIGPITPTIPVTDPTTGITATYTEYSDPFTIGAGQVDLWAAYNDTTMPVGSAASPRQLSTAAMERLRYS